jgi:hypothetical protein
LLLFEEEAPYLDKLVRAGFVKAEAGGYYLTTLGVHAIVDRVKKFLVQFEMPREAVAVE